MAVALLIKSRPPGSRQPQMPPPILTVIRGIINNKFSALTATPARLGCWTTSGEIGRRWLSSTSYSLCSSSSCIPLDAVHSGTTEARMRTFLGGSTLNLGEFLQLAWMQKVATLIRISCGHVLLPLFYIFSFSAGGFLYSS